MGNRPSMELAGQQIRTLLDGDPLLRGRVARVSIERRTKSIHSTWRKMQRRDCRVEEVHDLLAMRIILELKDRLGAPVGARGAAVPAASAEPWRDQVHQGLVGLGWSAKDADRAVDEVAPQAAESPDVATLLRSALRMLSKA